MTLDCDSLIITIWNLLFTHNKNIDNMQPTVDALEKN